MLLVSTPLKCLPSESNNRAELCCSAERGISLQSLLSNLDFLENFGRDNILPHVQAALDRAQEIFEGFDGVSPRRRSNNPHRKFFAVAAKPERGASRVVPRHPGQLHQTLEDFLGPIKRGLYMRQNVVAAKVFRENQIAQ